MSAAHTNITASPSARLNLGMYGTPSGRLRRPILRMHGIFDANQPPSVEAVYRSFAEAWGNGDRLLQIYVMGPHGSFSAEQYLAALAAFNYWLDNGIRPDATFFPESQGSDNSFVPPAWPY